MPLSYRVGARPSPLSRAQVAEVEKELRRYVDVCFEPVWIETVGDRDRKTSLKELEKTDFFTRDIDRALLNGEIDLAIHSAKDLPEKLCNGLSVAAITQGVDPRDTLVMRPDYKMPPKPRVATSSVRRAERVKELFPDAVIVDVRGNVDERIEKVLSGDVDALVAPEAALIRLNLTHLNRLYLEGDTAPGQGQLAVVVRSQDRQLRELLGCLDSRTVLYTGLRVPKAGYFHCPLIKVVPRPNDPVLLQGITHLLFTSRSAVEIFFAHYSEKISARIVAIGQGTAGSLEKEGYPADIIADEPTSEGVVETLKRIKILNPRFLWPHSSKARPIIRQAFDTLRWPLIEHILYDTVVNKPDQKISWETIGEVIFTSPSTVDACIEIFGALPDKRLRAIGPVTERHLRERLEASGDSLVCR